MGNHLWRFVEDFTHSTWAASSVRTAGSKNTSNQGWEGLRGSSVLLCGSVNWQVVKADTRKGFFSDASDEYARSFGPNKISNHQLYKQTDSCSITKEITHRPLRWLGHVLRMEQDQITRTGLKIDSTRQKKTWQGHNCVRSE